MAGGRTPWNAGWPSGKPIRPPPGAGVAQTGSRWRSASVTAASQAPEASTSGPTTSSGLVADSSRLARSRTASGSAAPGPVTERPIWCGIASASASASQSSIGIDTNTGPFGARPARCAPRASACGTSSARGGS